MKKLLFPLALVFVLVSCDNTTMETTTPVNPLVGFWFAMFDIDIGFSSGISTLSTSMLHFMGNGRFIYTVDQHSLPAEGGGVYCYLEQNIPGEL